MLSVGLAAVGLVTAAGTVNAAQQFTIAQNHTGSTFLDNWTFQNGIDANNTGNVLFQTREQAASENLTFVNSAGNYVIKVDNTTSGANDPTFGRPSVKVLSNYTIGEGDLIIMDAVHLPYGCSVWPAFWSEGPAWPDDGEIDIIEGTNMATQNNFSLHTLDGCTHPSSSSGESGTLLSTDCFNQTNGNQGCIVEVPGNSYGANFANNGGGAYALNWNSSGLYFYFFPRSSIPSDLSGDSPDPDSWGTPTAFYPTSSCDTSQFIKDQFLIIDITVCGNFAGAASVFSQTCSGTCTDLVATASNFDNAYFEMQFLRVFQQGSGSSSTGASGTSTAGGSSSTSDATRLGVMSGMTLFLVVATFLLAL